MYFGIEAMIWDLGLIIGILGSYIIRVWGRRHVASGLDKKVSAKDAIKYCWQLRHFRSYNDETGGGLQRHDINFQ